MCEIIHGSAEFSFAAGQYAKPMANDAMTKFESRKEGEYKIGEYILWGATDIGRSRTYPYRDRYNVTLYVRLNPGYRTNNRYIYEFDPRPR